MTDPRPAHGAEQGAPKIEGIDIPRVTAWLAERTEIHAPLSFKLIAGGRSPRGRGFATEGANHLGSTP